MQGMRSTERDDGPGTVLGRAMLILDTLAQGDVVGISALARRTGLAKTTVHRLVGELARYDLVEVTGDGARLGMRLFELGLSVPRQRSLREAALPFMRALQEATRETVHLAVLDGREVVYVEILHGAHAPRLPSRVGGRMPAHATRVGNGLGIVCVASPIFGRNGEVVAAVSLTGWSSRLDVERVAPAVRTAALALSRQLG